MSARTPFQRGKLEMAGAVDDLLAEIERERREGSPRKVTYHTWAIERELGMSDMPHRTRSRLD